MKAKDRSFLFDYYVDQADRFKDLLGLVSHRHSITTIHQLRVSIKRIKALFQLLQYIYPDFKAKDYYSLFKPVFRSSGVIRESQINLKLLKGYSEYVNLNNAYSIFISRFRKHWRNELIEVVKSFNYDKLARQREEVRFLFHKLGNDGSVRESKKFLRSEAESILTIVDSSGITSCLHDIRITFKNIKPILALAAQQEGSGIGKATSKHLATTEKHIGRWHDLRILGESVRVLYNASGSDGGEIFQEYSALMKLLNQQNSKGIDMICKWLDITLNDLIRDDLSPSSVICK
ncbi:MAG TPA: CHAD domain-containing protein [Bacteroidales bacterium]|nr:CHAD domain-containing protein [Bacteroidales bacterium]